MSINLGVGEGSHRLTDQELIEAIIPHEEMKRGTVQGQKLLIWALNIMKPLQDQYRIEIITKIRNELMTTWQSGQRYPFRGGWQEIPVELLAGALAVCHQMTENGGSLPERYDNLGIRMPDEAVDNIINYVQRYGLEDAYKLQFHPYTKRYIAEAAVLTFSQMLLSTPLADWSGYRMKQITPTPVAVSPFHVQDRLGLKILPARLHGVAVDQVLSPWLKTPTLVKA